MIQRVATTGLTSVIIVAADSGMSLIDCIADVLCSVTPLEVIVFDNDSRDGSIDALNASYSVDPRLRLVRSERNLGFGAGVNRAAESAHGDSLLLLNPDCRVPADAVSALRTLAAGRRDIGIIGASIVDAEGRAEPAARRRDPTLRRALGSLAGIGSERIELPSMPEAAALEPVDAVSGAAMWLPRTAFDALGGFDEDYFLHCEDLDICRRARDLGFGVYSAVNVTVTHAKGGSSRRRPVFVAWHKHRGMWRWFRRFDPAARNPMLAALVCIGLWMHFIATLPLRTLSGLRERGIQR